MFFFPCVDGIQNQLFLYCSYLNTQHIRSQKLSEAEIIYGNVTPNAEEQMEIGELGKKK